MLPQAVTDCPARRPHLMFGLKQLSVKAEAGYPQEPLLRPYPARV